MWSPMKELFILIAHLLTTLVKLAQPGGVRSVVAQSLVLRHQLLVLQRRRQRSPLKPVLRKNWRWAFTSGSRRLIKHSTAPYQASIHDAGQ
jgi:hypothetical protein